MESHEDFDEERDETQESLPIPATNRSVSYRHQNIQSPVKRYMTSSTARRKQMKHTDCKFCDFNIPASSLFDHLRRQRHKKCLFLYLKMHQVNTLEGLIAKLFSCEMCCNQERINFEKHLKKNKRCLEKYKLKFQEEDIRKIHEKVKALKRKTFPSRSSNYCKSLSESLNEYRENVAFGNFKLCVQCNANFREYGAREVKENEELFERFKLSSQEKRNLRRFEAYYLCNACAKSEKVTNNDEESKSILAHYEEHHDVTFFPPKVALSEPGKPVNQINVKIWYPFSIDAVEKSPNCGKTKCMSDMYKTRAIDTSDISALYQHELKKYENAKEREELYTGLIRDFETKKVDNIRKVSSCSKIAGSKDWFEVQISRMKERQEQLGFIHATIKINLPKESPDIVATALVQTGIPVTIEKRGLGNGELQLSYRIHLDHKSDTNCSSDCKTKMSLEEYITHTEFHIEDGSNAYTGTYVSSCHQKIISFARSIIQAPASGLCSQDYQLFLSFDDKGMASIVGCIWPDELNEINENIAKNNGEIADYEEELVRFIDQNISCTGDPRALRSRFHLSESEADDLSQLVLAKQLHNICDEVENCKFCSCPPLPSMETLVMQKCTDKNFEASKVLLSKIRSKLRSQSLEERKCTKSWNFLQDFWTNVDGEISENKKLLTLTFESEEDEIQFEIDGVLTKFLGKYNDSPKTGVYQYALSCVGNLDGSSIVFQRLWIVDSSILPFNPLHLKANRSTSVINIVNDNKLSRQFFNPRGGLKTPNEIIEPRIQFSHRLISLSEAIALSDPNIKIVQASTKEQYVNTKENRGVLLRKAKDDKQSHFKDVVNSDQFELLGDPISRHFNRVNTSDGLLLVETCAWYDYVGDEKSRELSETYKNCEIPKSEEPSVCSNGYLPEYILCKNGDVLKKRKKKKVIILPTTNTEREKMYSKSLLFLPIQTELELQGPACRDRFQEVNRDEQALIVELNERKMFPKKIFELTKVDLLDDLLEALDEVCEDEQSDDEL